MNFVKCALQKLHRVNIE